MLFKVNCSLYMSVQLNILGAMRKWTNGLN